MPMEEREEATARRAIRVRVRVRVSISVRESDSKEVRIYQTLIKPMDSFVGNLVC